MHLDCLICLWIKQVQFPIEMVAVGYEDASREKNKEHDEVYQQEDEETGQIDLVLRGLPVLTLSYCNHSDESEEDGDEDQATLVNPLLLLFLKF